MSTDLPGVALITGAAGSEGIGNAVAKAFVTAGCQRIVITDINAFALAETADILHTLASDSIDIQSIPGDISSPDFIQQLFSQIEGHFGRLDYAVNCAGILGDNLSSDASSLEAFDKVNGVNYRGLWMCVREELKIMKRQDYLHVEERDGETEEQREVRGLRRQKGSIVNIASQLGVVGRPSAPVIGLTRCDAIDASPFRIRVNAVCPGIIDTPIIDPLQRPSLKRKEQREAGDQLATQPNKQETPANADGKGIMDLSASVALAPMNRMGVPEEIADVCVFLSSEKASFVQGAAWLVDGGYTIN